MSNFLWPHGLQQPKLLCPPLSPGVHSNSRSLSRWCHPTISSSVVPFSFCLQSSPASGSFQMSQLFAPGGQNIGASVSVLPMTIQGWFPLRLTDLISFPAAQLESISSSKVSLLYGPTFTSGHDYWKNHCFDYRNLCQKSVISAF